MLSSPARTALRQAAAALDLAERYQQPLEMSLALAQMARCYRALQALGPAELYLERALAWARTLGAADQAVEILCLLAETSCSIGRTACARTIRGAATRRWNARATGPSKPPAWLAHVTDPQWEIKVLLRISDVLDRCGDHDDAVELQSRAMRLMYGPHASPDAASGVPPGCRLWPTAEALRRRDRAAAPAPAPRRCACRQPPPARACRPAPRGRPRRRLRAPGR